MIQRLGALAVAAVLAAACGRSGLQAPVEPTLQDVPKLEMAAEPNPITLLMMQRYDRFAFRGIDADGNGQITRREAPWLDDDGFRALDADGSGTLSYSEGAPRREDAEQMAKWTESALGGAFKALDQNSDGRVTRFEAENAESTSPLPPERLGASGRDASDFIISALGYGMSEIERQRATTPTPDGRNPVVLVPGYFLPSIIFLPLIQRMRQEGWSNFHTVEHWPGFQSIQTTSRQAAFATAVARTQSGAAKVDLIGHSMGGIANRWFIKFAGGVNVVDRYISFASPQQGTFFGYIGPGTSSREMRPGSPFMRSLNEGDPTPGDIRYTAIWSRTDEVVLPSWNGELADARNHSVLLCEHLQILYRRKTQDWALAALR